MSTQALRARAADERGSVMLLVSISMVMILGFTALTVDIGRLSGERRNLQDVADVVALDLVRELEAQNSAKASLAGPALAAAIEADPAFEQAIQRSAGRNDFPRAQLGVVVGRKNPAPDPCPLAPGICPPPPFVPGGSIGITEVPNAVEVTAGETVDFAFAEGSASTNRRAVAAQDATAGFTIGSYLASVDSAQNRILNRVIGDALGLQIVGYDGLVGATVTVEKIGLHMPTGVLTPAELLSTSITVEELVIASAAALRGDGKLAAASVLDDARSRGIPMRRVRVRDILEVGSGGTRSAAVARIDVLSLLTASAFVIDQDHAFTLDELGLTIPGVSAVSVQMHVIEPPVYAFGPVGVVAETAQVSMTVTPTFALTTGALSGDKCKLHREGLLSVLDEASCMLLGVLQVINVGDLIKLDITGTAPMVVTSASAKGTLKDVECATGSRSITIEPEVGAVTLGQSVNIAVKPTVRGVERPLISVQTAARSSATGGVRPPETFLEPTQFNVPRQVGTTPVGLAGLLALDTGSIQLGSVKLHKILDRFDQRLIDEINGALGRVDQQVISRLSKTLGFSLGGAELTALSMDCNAVRLAE